MMETESEGSLEKKSESQMLSGLSDLPQYSCPKAEVTTKSL